MMAYLRKTEQNCVGSGGPGLFPLLFNLRIELLPHLLHFLDELIALSQPLRFPTILWIPECRKAWDPLRPERNYAPESIDENRTFSEAPVRKDWPSIRSAPVNG